MFDILLKKINEVKYLKFDKATDELENFIYNNYNFLNILEEIGTIPESIEHDSTEEKLFSKVSDIVLSRAFIEIGLNSKVLKERGNSADVFAESKFHGYSLVADAKSFRMSRTAKNQKDFKINSLSKGKRIANIQFYAVRIFSILKKQVKFILNLWKLMFVYLVGNILFFFNKE